MASAHSKLDRTTALLAALVAAVLASAAIAQEQAPPAASAASSGNPFLGGVPDGVISEETLSLTLADAVQRGLEHNLGAILGAQLVRAAEAGRDLARSGLLPTVTGTLSAARQEIDLEAFGFSVPEGQSPVTPPFNVADARIHLVQPLFDLAALERARAGTERLEAARLGYRDVREVVVLTCASLYLQAALGSSRIDSVRAQEGVAVALLERAQRLKASGVAAGIEVLRAQVQREAQRQRVIFCENEFARQKLALARAIGLPLGQKFDLAEKLASAPALPVSSGAAIDEALSSRADLKQADAALRAAEAARRADRYQSLPSIRFNADAGWIGPNLPRVERTFAVGVAVKIPLFEGGRVGATVLQDDAVLRQIRARRDDLRARIEYAVRAALLDLDAAGERVKVARGALDLADEQLRQSQDRFSAGVAGNLEVVQAQDALAAASDSYLSALYAHNMARLSLSRAVGSAERSFTALLGGDGGNIR